MLPDMAIRSAVLGVVLLGLASSSVAAAPEAPEPPERPRIGVALSGGGALGTAHIGVLKVLEELRVPVDCIAGTSMGAIVGGLYALGLDASELEALVLDMDWRAVLDDRVDRRRLPFRRKVDDLTYLSAVEIGFNGGRFQLPASLIAGHRLGFELQSLTVPAVGLASFDELPIPFRAVATDLETGEAVVLSSGDLGRAIRASMAVPGVFPAMEIDGRLLVDGGLVQNLPVDLVRAMGADIVIAVDVGEKLRTRDELRSLTQIAGQLVSMTIARNVQDQSHGADVYLKVDLEGSSSTQFERAAEMIPRGEAAARELEPVLAAYGIGDEGWLAHRRRVSAARAQPLDHLVSVQLAAGSRADSARVLGGLSVRPGSIFDLEQLRRDLERLYESGDYERVDLLLQLAGDGYALLIEAHEKSWGPHTMRFGVNLVADFEGESSFNLLTNYTRRHLGPADAELKTAVEVGEVTGLAGEWYQPLRLGSRWFAAGGGFVRTLDTRRVLAPGDLPGLEQPGAQELALKETGFHLDLGLSLGRYGELRAGAVRGHGQASFADRGADLSDLELERGGWRFAGVLDQLDNPNLPRRGYLAAADLLLARRSMGSDLDYDRFEAALIGATSFGRHTILGEVRAGSALGSELPFWEAFQLGGFFNLSGYAPGELAGTSMAFAGVAWYRQLAALRPQLGSGVYAGLVGELGNVWSHHSSAALEDLRFSGAVFIGADTVFGPAYLGYGFAENGRDAWYLFVGRSF